MVFILLKSVAVREEKVFSYLILNIPLGRLDTQFLRVGVKNERGKLLLTPRPNQKPKSEFKNMVPLA